MHVLNIEIPDGIARRMDKPRLEALAREALAVRLYDLGDLSSGEASELLGISRREFLDLVGRYGVTTFDDAADPAREAAYGD
jgi:predicted HTH domain antitoxin